MAAHSAKVSMGKWMVGVATGLVLTGCAGIRLREQAEAGVPPPKPFRSDGCSAVPDLDFRACCVAHDKVYWAGGSKAQRKEADGQLARCIAATGRPVLGNWYGAGVRIGGWPWWPTTWRWGFGWPYGIGYFERRAGE